MKNFKYISKLFLGIIIILLSSNVMAQQDEQLTLQNYNPLYYNPAYAGSRDAISLVGVGRFQWVGMEGAPNTQWLSIHTPVIGKALGMGVHMVNDKIGTRNRTSAYYNISSSIRLNSNDARLAFGLSAGLDFLSRDFTTLTTIHDELDIHNARYGHNQFNVGAGIYYYSQNSYIGLSMPRILQASNSDPTNVVNTLNVHHFFLTAGHVFDINSVLRLKPTALVKYTPKTPITIDVGLSLLMYDKLNLGMIYRVTEALGANVVYQIGNFMHIGYGYEFPTNGLANHQSGSHEVLLQFDIRMKNSIYKSPRYF